MIDNDDEDTNPITEQRKSKLVPQPFDNNNSNSNSKINLDDVNLNPTISISIDRSYHDLPTIHHPEVSYSSLHNGLSSPEPNETYEPYEVNVPNESIIQPETKLKSQPEPKSQIESNFKDDFIHIDLSNDPPQSQSQPQSQPQSNLIKLYHNLLHNNLSSIEHSFLIITVKDEVKDKIIGSHKVYEISQYQPLGYSKETKCYRRYDNFSKLHHKLKSKFPYIMIPRLTPKNPLVKVLTFEEEFYENRRLQMLFYLNFLSTHNVLNKTREFNKFLNDANFDDAYFNIEESPLGSSMLTPSEVIKNKFITVWNYIGPSNSYNTNRKLNDSEVLIGKMSIHYRNIIDKYVDIKGAICDYIKSIKEDANDYKAMSESLYYIKDAFDFVDGSKEKMNDYSKFSMKVSNANKTCYVNANRLENKLEAMISMLNGICDAFERYAEFIRRYESVLVMLKSAKEGNWENIHSVVNEYDMCEILKGKFDLNLSQEANAFIEVFDEATMEVLEEFKKVLVDVNKEILI